MIAPVVLEARHLAVRFAGPRRGSHVQALQDISLTLRGGEVLGLVGESGSGKTTLARTLLGIQRESSGEILLDGQRVSGVDADKARRLRRRIQYVHQDAAASLDPWWSVGASLHEVLKWRGVRDSADRDHKISEVLALVGLDPDVVARYVHELSGGQLRRVALARILMLEPDIVILDEPTAGLDLSVQATVLSLLIELRARLGLTYLVISHDLSLVRRFCDHVAILYLGRIVETAPVGELFSTPRHPYTHALLGAMLSLEPGTALDDALLDNDPADHGNSGTGCSFQPRCAHAVADCAARVPPLEPSGEGREVACWRWRSLQQSI